MISKMSSPKIDKKTSTFYLFFERVAPVYPVIAFVYFVFREVNTLPIVTKFQ